MDRSKTLGHWLTWPLFAGLVACATVCLSREDGAAQTKAKDNVKKKKAKDDPKYLPPGWFGDYDAALAAANQTGKPLFVNFRCER